MYDFSLNLNPFEVSNIWSVKLFYHFLRHSMKLKEVKIVIFDNE